MCFLKATCKSSLVQPNFKPVHVPLDEEESECFKNEIVKFSFCPSFLFIPHLTFMMRESQIQQWIQEGLELAEKNSQQLK